MSDSDFRPEVWTTRGARKYVRRHRRTSRNVCTDLRHARNAAKAAVRDAAPNEVIKVVVWLSPTTRTVWLPNKGWSAVHDSDHRAKWIANLSRI